MTIRWTLAVAGLVALPAMVMIGTANNAMAQGRRTDTVTGSCVFAYGTASCVRQYRYNDAGNTGIKQYGEAAEEAAAEIARARKAMGIALPSVLKGGCARRKSLCLCGAGLRIRPLQGLIRLRVSTASVAPSPAA